MDIAAEENEQIGEQDSIDFGVEIYKNLSAIALSECWHPYYSSYEKVVGNMFDSNIDTYGSALGI